jgi:type I site-specific restriction-modification system R (restriction) subunit
MIRKEEVKSYRETTTREKRAKSETYSTDKDRIGPCDVTSKSELEKLIQDISSKEKYLNLLSTFSVLDSLLSHELATDTIEPSHQRRYLGSQSSSRFCLCIRAP